MKIGLMYGSDKERGREDRLVGLVEDVTAAEPPASPRCGSRRSLATSTP